MTATAEHGEYSVQMLISDWLLVDGTMDNHIQSAIDGAAPRKVAKLGSRIRQAGWDQIPGWPHDAEGFRTWPAPGQMATVTLTGTQWNLVVFAMRYWADVDERLSDTEGAAGSRAIAAVIADRLAAQGWRPESR